MKRIFVLFLLLLALGLDGWAQMKGGTPVKVSRITQVVNGKRYYVHIVEQGQTVYSISKAYGLKEVEAITKKDIHFLQIGDTVWLPCKGQKLPDGTIAPPATSRDAQTPDAPQAAGSAGQAAPTYVKPSSVSQDKNVARSESNEESQGPSATIRQRVNPQSIVISLMMPLYLSQMDKISTTKFDVEQRGKINYKSLEFIQFYEGLLIGLERLEKMGFNVVLNVVDVEGTSNEAVEKAFVSHNVAQSDLLITLLTRQPFEKAAALARDAQLFIVNPVSDRQEIVVNNPYVFKCLPSCEARARKTVQAIRNTLPSAHVYVVHSGAKAEKRSIQALTTEMDKIQGMEYTLVDWATSAKFTSVLKNSPQSVVISVYDQDKAKNRIFVSQLLNKLSSIKSKTPYLFTFDDWSSQYSDVDFLQLQNLNYHTFYTDWHLSTPSHKNFVDLFREKYKTEPTSNYAGMANDIILYFVCGLQQKGTAFFSSPVIPLPDGVIYPLAFTHDRQDYGFENQQALMYRMVDFQFQPVQ